MTSKHALTSEPILPTIWRLGLPNMVAMVATAGVSIAETTYVGQLGTLELAGMALVFPMIMLQQMLSAGSMGGAFRQPSAAPLAPATVTKPTHWYCTPPSFRSCWVCCSVPCSWSGGALFFG